MQGRAAPRLWVVGMRCHSKENYGWPKERHNRVHACWLRFCFMLLEDLGGCLFELKAFVSRQRTAPFP